MKTTVSIFVFAVMSAYAQSQTDYQTVHVLFNNHIEGDGTSQPGDPACPSDTTYQTLPLPPIGILNFRPSFAIDIVGTWLLRERTNRVTDSFGGQPKWFQCPVGEFWQTEADPRYGRRLFSSFNYLDAGDEFGIQGHAIFYSGQGFCWYQSPHSIKGIGWKFRDLHSFAESVYFNERKVNLGKTYTGGHKLESPALGTVRAEQIIDSVAYALGYHIAYEDHDGHLKNEPAGINNSRPSYFVYEAEYPTGVRIVKIDMNGSVNDGCSGNTPRCETSTEAIHRFDNTVAARLADPDTSRVYYFAVVDHASGYFAGKHTEVSGFPPRPGEYSALNTFLDTLQQRVQSGVRIKFVTPLELASIFYALGGVTSVGEDGLSSTPKNFVLYQNYPNPFNPSTTIRFSIPQRATLR
ncbi:MAG: hypothetical protein KJ666_07665 [Bacteroidetes bacterium]|nr:hypothetical protein [Bacteroidota bacterium]MBU2586011.1 hypothetical protein [Bacteroidota bacterium]